MYYDWKEWVGSMRFHLLYSCYYCYNATVLFYYDYY